jgi:hypothetical protein
VPHAGSRRLLLQDDKRAWDVIELTGLSTLKSRSMGTLAIPVPICMPAATRTGPMGPDPEVTRPLHDRYTFGGGRGPGGAGSSGISVEPRGVHMCLWSLAGIITRVVGVGVPAGRSPLIVVKP